MGRTDREGESPEDLDTSTGSTEGSRGAEEGALQALGPLCLLDDSYQFRSDGRASGKASSPSGVSSNRRKN